MRAMNKFAAVAMLTAMVASGAAAQSNTGDTGGSSFTGSVINFTPSGAERSVTRGVTTTTAGVAAAAQAFRAATGATNVSSGGQTGSLPAATAQALGAVLGGSPTPAQTQALIASLTGVSPGVAEALVTRLAGISGGRTSLQTVRSGFNAAVVSLQTTGAPIPPAMIAIRSALGG